MKDQLAGLPPEVRAALERPPADEKALLELELSWPALAGAEARVAARLRTFLLTWDPLGWLDERAPAWATATGDGDNFELVFYLPLEVLLAHAHMLESTVAESLALWAESVVAVAASHEALLVSGAYAELATKGKVPALLSEPRAERAFELPAIRLASSGWEPIGLGAIQDLVQEAFGPVDLERAPVLLEPASRPDPSCPACSGQRFGFLAELEEAHDVLCREHRAQAVRVRDERLARAAASNPAGWSAILEASVRLERRSFGVPLDVVQRLDAVLERDPGRALSWAELRRDADLALALARHLAGRPEALDDFRAEREFYLDAWLMELPFALAGRDLVDEAVQVADAYAELGEDSRAMFAGDAAVILAEAGRAGEALARVEENLRLFPDDFWTLVHAGDVHARLGDPGRAESAFRAAVDLALEREELEDLPEAYQRLADLLDRQPGRGAEAREAALEAESWRTALDDEALLDEEPRHVEKIGRNEPCPCGSGRKYKRCCGA